VKFYLMRHGEAEAYAATDAARCLTAEGKRKLTGFIGDIAAELQDVNAILHSPYKRATQTAGIVAETLGISAIEVLPEWIPEGSPSAALVSLEPFADLTPLVVTHLPLVGYVTALCCEGSEHYPLPFVCGEIVRIQADWPAAGLGQMLQNWRPV